MEKTKKSQTEGKKMKQVIEDTLKEMCSNSRASVNSETGRGYISDALLNTFRDNHIVFYTNLEEARKDPKMMNQIDISTEKGL